jgi:hypothetical protein
MWLLVWFMFSNNRLEHYVLGQHSTELLCEGAREEAMVLVTNSTTVVYCFEAIPEQKG